MAWYVATYNIIIMYVTCSDFWIIQSRCTCTCSFTYAVPAHTSSAALITSHRKCSSHGGLSAIQDLLLTSLHSAGSKIFVYRLLTEGIPDDSPSMYIRHPHPVLYWQMAPMGSWEIDDTIFSDMCASSPLVQLLEYIEACHICEGVAEPSLLAAVNMQTHNAFWTRS